MPGPVVVLSGPPGAGKTTLAAAVAATHERGVHLPQDRFWGFIASGFVPPWLPESHEQNTVVGRAVHSTALDFASGGYTVVLDGVVLPWSLDSLLVAAGECGVDVHYVVLRPDVETCLARTAARPAGELSEEGPIRHLHSQFVDLGRWESHVLDDATVAGVLDGVRAGRFVVR